VQDVSDLRGVGVVVETGTVALASQLSLGTWLVPYLINGFRVEHPGVQFVLEQSRDELVSSVLGGGRVDLEITALRPTDRTVRWQRLLTEPLCLAVPADHRLADRRRISLTEVSEEVFVTLRPASLLRRQGNELCERAGFRPTVGFETDDLPTVRGMVAGGLGVAIVPAARDRAPDATPAAVHRVPIEDKLAKRDVGLAWSTERRLLPAAELFRQYVLERWRR
jgi:DNA-binding transcriptional LysR family regulator